MVKRKKETIEKDIDQQTIREYDGLIGLTMLNLFSISKERKAIRLYHFDKKNKEHLYILRVALMARDIYNFPIEVEGSWWNIFYLNWKIKKGFDKVKRYKPIINDTKEELYAKGGIPVPELLELMRPDGIKRLGENFTFADIYHQYYEGSLN